MFCLKTIVIEFSNLLASGGGNTAKESGSSESCQKSCQVQTFGGFETSLKTLNSSEMGSEVGERVGYKVRFQEQSGPNTQVSLKGSAAQNKAKKNTSFNCLFWVQLGSDVYIHR